MSQEFLEKKLYLAVYKNEITFEIATHILKNNLSEEIGRKGMLHFTCSLSSLNEEDGVSKFFKAWGGEAIYNVH